MRKTLLTNVRSTVSINFHNKKIRYKMNCHILHALLLVLMLLFIIAITFYLYTKNKSKQKNIGTFNTKIEKNNELNKAGFKNRMC